MEDDYTRIIQEWKDMNDVYEPLKFYSMDLSHIPTLPENVLNLWIIDCKCEVLPRLPPNLIALHCHNLKIKQIPELPDSLKYFTYSFGVSPNEHKVLLPNKLPSNLIQIVITNVANTVLPEFPDTLQVFDIGWSNYTELPKLSDNLRMLDCRDTSLLKLPELLHECMTLESFHGCKNLPPILEGVDTIESYHARLTKKQHFVKDFPDKFELYASRKRSISRCKAIKERLMAYTWHPDRVLDWCDPKAFEYED